MDDDLLVGLSGDIDGEKERKFEQVKMSVQESVEASEMLMSSERLPKELAAEDSEWQQPQYEKALMPGYSADQIERICQVQLDLSQFNCDREFLDKAFSITKVEL